MELTKMQMQKLVSKIKRDTNDLEEAAMLSDLYRKITFDELTIEEKELIHNIAKFEES